MQDMHKDMIVRQCSSASSNGAHHVMRSLEVAMIHAWRSSCRVLALKKLCSFFSVSYNSVMSNCQ